MPFVTLRAGTLLLLAGCTTVVEVERSDPPLIEYRGSGPGLGVLAIAAPDSAAAPQIYSEIKQLFISEAATLTVIDYTGEGYSPKWSPDPNAAPALPAVPASVQTPLCVVIGVSDWRVSSEVLPGGKQRQTARVAFAVTTFTRGGELLQHRQAWASATSGFYGLVVDSLPHSDQLVAEYDANYPEHAFMSDPAAMFRAVLRAAVAWAFFPFLPHRIVERFEVDDDGEYRDGVALLQRGQVDAAIDAWTRVSAAHPRAGAFYDLAIGWLAKGDLDRATEMLNRSLALGRSERAVQLLDRVRERAQLRRMVAP